MALSEGLIVTDSQRLKWISCDVLGLNDTWSLSQRPTTLLHTNWEQHQSTTSNLVVVADKDRSLVLLGSPITHRCCLPPRPASNSRSAEQSQQSANSLLHVPLVLVSSLQESAPPTPPRASQGSPAPSGRGLVQVDTWEELRGLREEKEHSAIRLQNIFHTSDKKQ